MEEDHYYSPDPSRWHPIHWLLFVLGWVFRASWHREPRRNKKPYRMYRWRFERRHDPRRTRQHVMSVESETYWFSEPTHRLNLEWAISTSRRGLKLTIGIPFICMHYVRIVWCKEVWFAKKLRGEYPNSLEYGLQIHSDALVWNWAQDSMAWARDGSTGFHYYLSWDKFRELPKPIRTPIMESDIPFTQPAFNDRPATDHRITIKYETVERKYRRWWNRRKSSIDLYADVSLEKPPKFSGKGENSWDCGDDGIFGMSFKLPWEHTVKLYMNEVPAEANAEVVAKYIAEVEKNRVKYG